MKETAEKVDSASWSLLFLQQGEARQDENHRQSDIMTVAQRQSMHQTRHRDFSLPEAEDDGLFWAVAECYDSDIELLVYAELRCPKSDICTRGSSASPSLSVRLLVLCWLGG